MFLQKIYYQSKVKNKTILRKKGSIFELTLIINFPYGFESLGKFCNWKNTIWVNQILP